VPSSERLSCGARRVFGIGDRGMSGWNRLFVIVAVCWAVVAPFLALDSINRPVEQTFDWCADSAYRRYGASDSTVRLDWDMYTAERDKCLDALVRNLIGLPQLFSAMIGVGNQTHGLVAWGTFLIPVCLLWVLGWCLGRIVRWVAAGFRR
jgi:hypothetical protein